jgi:(4S)-4-hydroxy-5-phosphonooxypentane-2,3-dione isomerase
MLILHVNIHVLPGRIEAFREATLENARASIQEPGIARFDLLQNAEDPNRFALWEVYKDDEAIVAHKATAHWAKWTQTVESMMAEPRTRTWYKTVFPGDESY